MSQGQRQPTRRPGRPRSEAARRAILDSAYRLLLDKGLGRLTIEAVAAEAGVGKPTIYRYWPNAQELAMAALLSRPVPDGGKTASLPLKEALRSHLEHVLAAFATNRGRQIVMTMASADSESELSKAFRNQIMLRSREIGREILGRAEKAGEVRIGDRMETLLDMLYGPIFYRLLAAHLPISPDLADEIANIAVASIER